MKGYATVEDIRILWRTMTEDEESRAEALIPVICDMLRTEASKIGKDLDALVEADEPLANVAKMVVVDVVARTLMTSTHQEPMTQFSESGFGYTVSGSYLIPGGGIFIKDAELKRLGLKRQKIGVIDLWGTSEASQ